MFLLSQFLPNTLFGLEKLSRGMLTVGTIGLTASGIQKRFLAKRKKSDNQVKQSPTFDEEIPENDDIVFRPREDIENPIPIMPPIVREIRSYLELIENSRVQRHTVRAKMWATISQLRNSKEAMIEYLNLRFGDREKLYEKYFNLIDKALISDNEALLDIAFEGLFQIYSADPTEGVERIIAQCDRMNSLLR